ncbi:zinc finger protein 729-like [Ochlerotatus camptorhynchus]|uniref:zinc finger protein 729-like n=1 Tax=Ochlerotatus camptorhynchus TaxID=644619 RepID=UPI0031D24CEA
MVECGICLEDYREGDLELHREMCVVRLMFRCSLCDEDYVSKEGLWNHLDLHEIEDEGKELHSQEIKAKHKLHQCVLCNDQRAYSESPYWKHVHDVHDGFFLRCYDCGEKFRSEMLKNDHAFRHCKAWDQTVDAESSTLEEERVPVEVGNMTSDAEYLKLSRGEQSGNAHDRLGEHADSNIIDKETALPTAHSDESKDLRLQFACDICGTTFSSKGLLLRHKRAKHSCMEGKQQNCPHCQRVFQIKEYRAHLPLCKQKTFSCELCPFKFETSTYLARHMRNHHRRKGALLNEKQDQTQVKNMKNIMETTINSAAETTTHSGHEALVFSSDSSSSSSVVEGTNISTTKKNPSGTSSGMQHVESPSNHPYSCNVCGITMSSFNQITYHMLTRHTEGKFRCPHCSKKFHFREKLQKHASCCTRLKYSCELCGEKFNFLKKVKNHKKRVHHGSRPISKANVADCTEEQKQQSVEMTDAAHEMTVCIFCSITFASSDELMKHKVCMLTCPEHAKEHDDSQFGAEEISLLHGGKEAQTEIILKDRSDPKKVAENPSSILRAPCTKCSHCGITESSAVALAHHIRIHHDPAACGICGITLSTLSQAQHHKKTKHKLSKLKCPHCSMRFSGRERLQGHVSKCEKKKVPCEFCGKMFQDVTAVKNHWTFVCRAYKKSQEQEQKSSEARPLVESGSSQTKCYYCNEEFSTPGHLNHHLQIRHELTKCDICGITILGISPTKNHEIKCHMEPKYKCPTCGKKFHRVRKYNAHCFVCEHKMYSCKLCGRTFNQPHSIKFHNKRYHPDETGLENLQIVQDHKQVENNDLQIEITEKETTSSAREDQEQSTVNSSSKDEVSNSRLDEHSLANMNDDDLMEIEVINKESQMVSVAPLNGSSERQVVAEKTSQPLVENPSNHPYSCNVCGITLSSFNQITYHMLTRHTEGKFQCPHCSKKFHFKEKLQKHASCCARLKYSCELCGQKFNFLSKVENHKKRDHHGDRPLENANIDVADCTEEQKQHSVEKTDAAHENTTCIICSITFASSDELMKHKLTCPKLTKEPDDSQFGAEEISLLHGEKEAQTDSTIVRQGENIIFILKHRSDPQQAANNPSSIFRAPCTKCSHCGIKESSAVALACHILVNHEPVACGICGITLPTLSQAQQHKKTKHNLSKLKCPHCSIRFSGRERLQLHVSKCEKKKVPCEFCGKMFQDVTAVKNHWSYVCRAYKKSQEQDLKNSGARPLVESGLSHTKCYYCNQEFSNPGQLNHHLQIRHELTKCDICEITILGISSTKNHEIKCHMEPKYKCPTCGKKFHRAKSYNSHRFVCEHKMYSCKLCGRTFKQPHSIKFHNKRYHPNETGLKNLQIVQDQNQVRYNDLQMARDTQGGRSTVNPSAKVANSGSNEYSSANLTNDDCMESKVIDEESRMVSEKTSQPLVENPSNQPYSCNVCGITMSSYYKISYHMLIKHTEEKFQCPHCPRKFHHRNRLEKHAPTCTSLKHSCELCGEKFSLPSRVEMHKKKVHQGDRPLRNANIKGANYTEEQKQRSVEKMDATHEMAVCIICRSTFASTDELMKHKLTCPKHGKKHDDSQFGAEVISQLHVGKEAQTDLELDIKVEETMLQEQEYQVPTEDPGRPSATTLIHIQHPHGGKSRNVAGDLANGIKVKEEYLEDEDEILSEHQTATESAECYEIPSDRNGSLVSHEAGDQIWRCSICGLTFGRKHNLKYHRVVCHTDPRYKCFVCRRPFHFASFLRRHEKICLKMRCNKCGVKFNTRLLLNNHYIDKHPHDGKSKDVEASSKDRME